MDTKDFTAIEGQRRDVEMDLAKAGYVRTTIKLATYEAVRQMMCSNCHHIGEMYPSQWALKREPVITLGICRVCGWSQAV